jgi:hypothetical protein
MTLLVCKTLIVKFRKTLTLSKKGIHSGKKRIKFKIIRPQKELAVKIDKFNKSDIKQMIELGKETAEQTNWID